MVNLGNVFVLWACKSGGWEHDYVHELFPGSNQNFLESNSFNFTHFDAHEFAKLNNPEIKPRVLIYNIENAGADGAYSDIRSYVSKYRITILVHTADEFQGSSRKWKYGEGVEVYNLVMGNSFSLFLCYHVFTWLVCSAGPLSVTSVWHKSIQKLRYPKVQCSSNTTWLHVRFCLKLKCYTELSVLSSLCRKNMLHDGNHTIDSLTAAKNSLLRKASDRNNSWSFVGSPLDFLFIHLPALIRLTGSILCAGTVQGHKDRAFALAVFSAWKPFVHDAGLTPIQMRNIYLDSKFVLIGRGQSNLDCYRIYEAIIAGAVPVSSQLYSNAGKVRNTHILHFMI